MVCKPEILLGFISSLRKARTCQPDNLQEWDMIPRTSQPSALNPRNLEPSALRSLKPKTLDPNRKQTLKQSLKCLVVLTSTLLLKLREPLPALTTNERHSFAVQIVHRWAIRRVSVWSSSKNQTRDLSVGFEAYKTEAKASHMLLRGLYPT